MKKGFSIIECIISLAILSLSILGIVSLTIMADRYFKRQRILFFITNEMENIFNCYVTHSTYRTQILDGENTFYFFCSDNTLRLVSEIESNIKITVLCQTEFSGYAALWEENEWNECYSLEKT